MKTIDIEESIENLRERLKKDINVLKYKKKEKKEEIDKSIDKAVGYIESEIKEIADKITPEEPNYTHSVAERPPIFRNKTHILNIANISIVRQYPILDIKMSSGEIREVSIISPVKFNTYMEADDVVLFEHNNSFDAFEKISDFSDTVDAFVNTDGNYVVCIKDIKFLYSIKIYITVTNTANIQNIFCIYEISYDI